MSSSVFGEAGLGKFTRTGFELYKVEMKIYYAVLVWMLYGKRPFGRQRYDITES
jgi:hypothetical protein